MTRMLIKNYDQILSEELPQRYKILRQIVLNALEKAINSIKPDKLIEKAIKVSDNNLVINENLFNLKAYRKIYIIGGGKAAAQMALSLENILITYGNIDYEGIVNIPTDLNLKEKDFPKKVKLNFASHPTPDVNGLNGTRAMMKIIEKASEEDLIICLISGGGSALLPSPKGKVSIKDLKEINLLLLASGASIDEINTIRKHISNFKGGNLAKRVFECSKATLISLIISDVVGNKLDVIASGPTVPDSTTYQDAYDILSKYKIIEKVPHSIKEVIDEGLRNPSLENPKEGDVYFQKVYSYLIGSVEIAVQEIMNYLNQLGITCKYFSNQISGEAREFAKELHDIISNEVKIIQKDLIDQTALIGTGELTVTLKGKGVGGRNQEMLLSYLNLVRYEVVNYNYILLAVNLDGIEGNSKAMGALVDNYLKIKINSANINLEGFLNNNDSNSFFKRFNSEIITGSTGSNVNDLILLILSKSKININIKK